jgi:LysM repeat protein
MENEIKTESTPIQNPFNSSFNKQRFPLSSLEIVFGSLIVLGLIFIGYIIFFQDSSGTGSRLEKKIKNLETISREQGEKLEKSLKAIQDGQAQLESRLKALETANQGSPAKQGKMELPKAGEKKPSPDAPGKKKIQHKVKKGETLQSIAAKYKVTSSDLLQWNKRGKNKPVRAGETLTIMTR